MTTARRPSRPPAGRPARSAAPTTAAPFDPFTPLVLGLLRLETLGWVLVFCSLAVAVAAAAGIPLFERLSGPPVRAIGLLLFPLAAAVTALGLLIALHRFRPSRRLAWRTLGWTLAAVAGAALLGLLTPAITLAGVPLGEVSLGGDVGWLLSHTGWGLLLSLAAFAGASAIVWPGLSRRTLALVPPAAATVWRWRLPQRFGRLVVDGFRGLFFAHEAATRTPAADPDDDLTPATIAPIVAPRPAPVKRGTSAVEGAPLAEEEPPIEPPAPAGAWPRPPRDLLQTAPKTEVSLQDNAARAQLIVDTLASFGVDAKVVAVSQGPTVTQFGIEPGWEVKTRTVIERDANGRAILDKDGRAKSHLEEVSRTRVRVNEVTRLANDLALALAAPAIRIEAPVPGKPVIGVEVPNTNASVVSLRGVLETPTFQRLGARSKLALALGQGVSGEVVVADLARMPHLLIAGATGSGKSVCINSIIASILMHASPDEVRFVMVDPKRVELTGYEPIPHLALSRVIVDMDEVVGTLGAVIQEMDARYRKFASINVRNLEAYNKHASVTVKLPQWVVIIDELADLMMTAAYDVEKQICRLAQLARATGIHLVIATQRPSVDVITGLIKANFPTRIAFAVTSQVDSRTILDTGGAEKLLGRGDMLYLATDAAKPRRIQGVYVSDEEIERLVAFWSQPRFASMRPPTFDHLVEQARAETAKEEQEDPMLERARELAEEHSRISTSMLQRRLRIGYPRAARLMDLLEAEGVVGVAEGQGSRATLDERD